MIAITHRRTLALLALLLISSLCLLPAAVHAQQNTPVIGLIGTLLKAENKPFANMLVTGDTKIFGVVGQSPDIEVQIEQLRQNNNPAIVRVWGTLYPMGLNSSDPVIVVTAILPFNLATPTATPKPSTAVLATVIVDAANLRSGPDVAYAPPIGALQQGQTCIVIGRNATGSWLQLRCSDTLTGWVLATLLSVNGVTDILPIVAVAAPPPPPKPTPQPVEGWRASYFNNPNLEGLPAFQQTVPAIDFNWGGGSPNSAIPGDRFSARFERTFNFSLDDYRFTAKVDDGVRVYLDGQLLINEWHYYDSGIGDTFVADRRLEGIHTLTVEYYEDGGDARITFTTNPVRFIAPQPLPVRNDLWAAEYFNNTTLFGPAVLTRYEQRVPGAPLNTEFGSNSPVPGQVLLTNWSARWKSRFYFEGGAYVFSLNAAQGARLYLDGILVVNGWDLRGGTASNRFYELGRGEHEISVEYFKETGFGYVRAWWQVDASGPQ
jgi:hypothetical protein